MRNATPPPVPVGSPDRGAVKDMFGKTPAEARAALAKANPNVLRIALYQATRDPDLAAMTVEITPVRGGAYRVPVLAEAHRDAVVDKAMAFLQAGAPEAAPPPDDDSLAAMMALFAGGPVSRLACEMGRVDLADDPFPIRADWRDEPSDAVKALYPVVIVGAGFGGMAAAIQIKRLGIAFTIVERDREAGGTWWRNHYPEARVDVASHHYQFSFMRKYPWRHWYAPAGELFDYGRAVVERFGLRDHIRFETELTDAVWDAAAARWRLTLRTAGGEHEAMDAAIVISAAGLFNAVNLPDIAGLDSFAGEMFHSTAWNHDFDPAGKRVAQIGVGSTGAQLMPHLAREAATLTIFQRSPQWVMPVDGYRDAVPDEVQWLVAHFPHYWNWLSFGSFYANLGADPAGLHDYDREWQRAGGRISPRNDALRAFCEAHIQSKLGHDPELARKATPDFPPYGKRPVIDNGWFDALARPNVALVTEPIERITPRGVLTRDGVEHPADLLVLCAGFKAERYLWPVRYVGRGGRTLEEAWATDGARAHLGMTVRDFPNLFILYGPNAQARLGGLIKWLEAWARYAITLIVELIERGGRSIAVHPQAFDDYNARLDEATSHLVWQECPSYYVNEHGRQAVNAPWSPDDYWSMIREPALSDFEIEES